MLTALGVMTSLSVRLSSRCAFNTVTGVYELRGSFFQSKKKLRADCDERSTERVSVSRAWSGCGRHAVGIQVSSYRHLTWALVAAVKEVGESIVASQCWREQKVLVKGLTVREDRTASRFQNA